MAKAPSKNKTPKTFQILPAQKLVEHHYKNHDSMEAAELHVKKGDKKKERAVR